MSASPGRATDAMRPVTRAHPAREAVRECERERVGHHDQHRPHHQRRAGMQNTEDDH